MKYTPESKVKEQIKRFLKERKCYYFMPVQTGRGMPGLDFHCVYQGRAFFIEAKAPGKQPTPRQQMTMKTVTAAGAAAFVVTQKEDLQYVQNWIDNDV